MLTGAGDLAMETHHPEKAFNFMEMSIQGMQYVVIKSIIKV